MPSPKRSHWTNCSIAGLLGFFLMTGRRHRRGQIAPEDQAAAPTATPQSSTPDTSAQPKEDVSQSQAINQDPSISQPSSRMTSLLNDLRQSLSDNLGEITPRQWAIAAAVLVGVPIVAFVGTFYIYPYAEDLLGGESTFDSVLAEYGVSENAETQLLTIRRGDLVNSVSVNGTLEYANRERLSFGTTGTIDAFEVEVGDFVSRGDVLMSLEPEAIVTAGQNLQSASVALQDAEENLDELINPDEQTIGEATLNVLTAYQSITDAEESLANLIEPSATDIATAELDVAEAKAAVDQATDKLADLQNPSASVIENAKLAVAEAEQTLDDLLDELTDLAGLDGTTFTDAELTVAEAIKSRNEALETLEDTTTIDESARAQADLDVAKARLALVEARSAVTDAEIDLHNATENAGDQITSKKLEIAKAEADLAAAAIAHSDAQEALSDAQKPFDEDEVADLRTEITEAEEDVEVAQNQFRRLEIQTDAETRTLKSDLYEARNRYRDMFYMWLGMDISSYEWRASPEEIFADIGATPAELLAPLPLYGSLDPRREDDPANNVVDNPQTPWDEVVTTNWAQFFGDQLRFNCEDDEQSANLTCVNLDFDNAWDDLLLKTEAYDTAMLDYTQQFDNAEDATDNAKSKLEDLQEQLEEALTPTDAETLKDLFAKAEVASYTLVDAQNKRDSLLEELERVEPQLESQRLEAEQALAVARESLKVAQTNLTDSEHSLAEIEAGPSEEDIAIANANAKIAETAVIKALNDLNQLQKLESPDLIVLNQQINAAKADLQLKTDDLNALVNGDQIEIGLAQSELASARQELADKLTAFQDLISPHPADIELARQEIVLSRANLNAAEDDLKSLINPDPATVALRRAEVATAREELATAIAATEGTQIIAPFNGVIANIPVEEGQTANPNNPAVVIADPSIVEISGTVDEVDVLFLQVGDPASIELEALGDEPLIGNISDIATFGESEQGVVTYPVTIQTEQPAGTQLPEGLSAVAEVIIREQTDKLLVPIQALFGSVNDPILLISNEDGSLQHRSVTLGISDDFWTVIEDGVSEGETILMTVVGSDTSQFGGFGAIRAFGGGPPRGGN